MFDLYFHERQVAEERLAIQVLILYKSIVHLVILHADTPFNSSAPRPCDCNEASCDLGILGGKTINAFCPTQTSYATVNPVNAQVN